MDRTKVSGTFDVGSIPAGGTFQGKHSNNATVSETVSSYASPTQLDDLYIYMVICMHANFEDDYESTNTFA